MNEIISFCCFLALVILLLALDLGVFHKKDHVIGTKEAAIWTAIWIGIALLFCGFIYLKGDVIHGIDSVERLNEINVKHHHGLNLSNITEENLEVGIKAYRHTLALEYLTGYLTEKALSIDNIFVMIMIFMAFGVDKKYYHRVLFFGIIGAIVLRFLFIFAAGALIERFDWILLIFGAVLIFTGVKMFLERKKKESIDVAHHPVVKFLSKRKLSTTEFHGHDFFAKIDGKWLCTPLFIVLIIIEFSDVIFAFDSIPAIFGITQDTFIVFYSNIFAILGLRSLFFLLESIMDRFYYLKIGLAVLLAFIGAKMILPFIFEEFHIGTGTSLLVIVGILLISIFASIWFPPKEVKAQTVETKGDKKSED